jgi:hypothetical protein
MLFCVQVCNRFAEEISLLLIFHPCICFVVTYISSLHLFRRYIYFVVASVSSFHIFRRFIYFIVSYISLLHIFPPFTFHMKSDNYVTRLMFYAVIGNTG